MIIQLKAPFLQQWQSLDPFYELLQVDANVKRALEGRRTFEFKCAHETFYAKMHEGIGWQEIIKNLVSGRLPILGASTEKNALDHLQKIGVPTLEWVGFAQSGWNPATQRSFLITKKIENRFSLETLLLVHRHRLTDEHIHRLVVAVAQIVGKMHGSGMNHRDLYLCHFLLVNNQEFFSRICCPELVLIDLHRAQIRSSVPRRWLIKDLAALWYSALGLAELAHWFSLFVQVYLDHYQGPFTSELKNRKSMFWKTVAERVQQMQSREHKFIQPNQSD